MEWKTPGPRVGIKAAASRPPGLRFSDAREDAIFAIHFLIENIKQDLLVYEMQFRLVGSVWRIFLTMLVASGESIFCKDGGHCCGGNCGF